MNKKEILEKVQKKKVYIGEMEKSKIDKSNWISVIITGVVALIFIIVLSMLGDKAAAFGIGCICFTWAGSFYFCQYFIAKRPVGVLIGAIFETFGALIMLLNFILTVTGVV